MKKLIFLLLILSCLTAKAQTPRFNNAYYIFANPFTADSTQYLTKNMIWTGLNGYLRYSDNGIKGSLKNLGGSGSSFWPLTGNGTLTGSTYIYPNIDDNYELYIGANSAGDQKTNYLRLSAKQILEVSTDGSLEMSSDDGISMQTGGNISIFSVLGAITMQSVSDSMYLSSPKLILNGPTFKPEYPSAIDYDNILDTAQWFFVREHATGQMKYRHASTLGTTYTASNGIEISGSNIQLGSAFIKNTSMDGNGWNVTLGASGNRLGNFRVWSGGTISLDASTNANFQVGGSTMNLTTTDGSLNTASGGLAVGSSGHTFTDTRGTAKGVEYAADYSAGFTTRSLVDKAYVDAAVSGGSVSDGDKGDITVIGGGATWTVDNTAITYAKFQNLTGMSVFGRSANSSGVGADITAGSDHNILRRSGTSIGFGEIDLSQSGAVGSSVLPVVNGGTGNSSAFTTGSVLFAGATGAVSQDNTNFFWDNTAKQLKIQKMNLIPVAAGTTNNGDIVYSSSANAFRARIAGNDDWLTHNLGWSASNQIPLTSGTARLSGTANLTFNSNVLKVAGTGFFTNSSANTVTANTTLEVRGSLTQSSGSTPLTSVLINPVHNTTGTYFGEIRGVYYNPTNTSLTGATHIAFENTSGEIRFGGVTQDDTKTRIAALDATTGKLFYRDASTIGTTYTASNGTWLDGTTFKLGTTLTENTTIAGDNNNLSLGDSGDELFQFSVYTNDLLTLNSNSGISLNAGSAINITPATNTTLNTGINGDGSGLKHGRITTGSIAALTTTNVTFTWSNAFANANYTVTPSVVDSNGDLEVVDIISVSGSAVVVAVRNNNVLTARTGTLHLMAIHD